MKRVEAYVRPNSLEAIKDALEQVGLIGMSVEQVRGFGRQQGRTDKYRGSTYALNLLPKVKIDVVVPDDELENAIEAITSATQTGEIGDGKIFVTEVLEAVRIRTAERGDAALQ